MGTTARQAIDRILDDTGVPRVDDTVDTFKEGDPDAAITGIATTFLATHAVLQTAADSGLNLVITHEPIYYNHRDETKDLEGDPVVKAKRALIRERRLIVWRYHDFSHAIRPDAILQGLVEAFGWQEGNVPDAPCLFEFPETALGDLAGQLREKTNGRAVRVMGDLDARCSNAWISVGFSGTHSHLAGMRDPRTQLLVIGEGHEWESIEYVRDARYQGRKVSMIVLGHCNSEEPGMEYIARMIEPLFPDLPIKHIPAGDPFIPAP